MTSKTRRVGRGVGEMTAYGIPVTSGYLADEAAAAAQTMSGNVVITHDATGAPVVAGVQVNGNIVTPTLPTQQVNLGGNVTFSFTTSNGTNTLNVGDTWSAVISGATPNSAVIVSGGQPGATGNNSVGTTDANGNFQISGTATSDEVGSWSEQWLINGDVVGAVSFNVVNGTTTQSNSTATQTGATTSGSVNAGSAGTTTDTSTTTTSSTLDDFMAGMETLFTPSSWSAVFASGDFVAIAGLLAIPAVAAYMFMKNSEGGFRGRR